MAMARKQSCSYIELREIDVLTTISEEEEEEKKKESDDDADLASVTTNITGFADAVDAEDAEEGGMVSCEDIESMLDDIRSMFDVFARKTAKETTACIKEVLDKEGLLQVCVSQV
jgi:hypothetical protein